MDWWRGWRLGARECWQIVCIDPRCFVTIIGTETVIQGSMIETSVCRSGRMILRVENFVKRGHERTMGGEFNSCEGMKSITFIPPKILYNDIWPRDQGSSKGGGGAQ